MKPNYIVIFTRPWEVHFHITLSRCLADRYPNAKIRFTSFYTDAIRVAEKRGFDTVYLPERLQKVSTQDIQPERLTEMDAYATSYWGCLNTMLQTERFLPESGMEKKDFMLRHLAVLDELLPPKTLSISSMFDHFAYLAAASISFMKGGAHFAFVGCGLPAGRVLALKSPSSLWQSPTRVEMVETIIEQALQDLETPPEDRIEYMRPRTFTKEMPLSRKFKRVRHLQKRAWEDFRGGSYFPTPAKLWPATMATRTFRKVKNNVPSSIWDFTDSKQLHHLHGPGPSIYLALHMEPEATVNMYSPFYRDQLKLIEHTSMSMPAGYKLIVKENPKMLFVRPPSFYKAVKQIPNTLIASPNVSSTELLRRSDAVISLGGTVTIEAAIMGKASFCMGKPPFHYFATETGNNIFRILPQLKTITPYTKTDLIPMMERWLSGMFEGESSVNVYNEEIQDLSVNSSLSNAETYFSYISGCLKSLPDQEPF